eukprot:1194531-Prorocentrum_minimum.AAC.11
MGGWGDVAAELHAGKDRGSVRPAGSAGRPPRRERAREAGRQHPPHRQPRQVLLLPQLALLTAGAYTVPYTILDKSFYYPNSLFLPQVPILYPILYSTSPSTIPTRSSYRRCLNYTLYYTRQVLLLPQLALLTAGAKRARVDGALGLNQNTLARTNKHHLGSKDQGPDLTEGGQDTKKAAKQPALTPHVYYSQGRSTTTW